MTVINMVSFGDEGAAVADEQASTPLRKYNVAQKLRLFNNQIVYGGSGSANALEKIYGLSKKVIERKKKEKGSVSLEEAYVKVNDVLIEYKNRVKNNVLRSNLGISFNEMITGTHTESGRPLDESAKNAGRALLQQVDENYAMGVLLGGIEDGRFEIYSLNTGGTGEKLSRPYCSIGIGADESDKVLSNYVSRLPRDKREDIDKYEGLVKIIEATNAASNLNVGVGGVLSIAYVANDGISVPNENQSILASEIVEGLTRGLLDRNFAYQAVNGLVTQNFDFEEVEEKMKLKAKDWGKLDRILRGYKE